MCVCVCVCSHAAPLPEQTLKPRAMKMMGLRNQKAGRQMGGQWNASNQKPAFGWWQEGGWCCWWWRWWWWWWWRVWAESVTRVGWGNRTAQPEMPLQFITTLSLISIYQDGGADYTHTGSLTHSQSAVTSSSCATAGSLSSVPERVEGTRLSNKLTNYRVVLHTVEWHR